MENKIDTALENARISARREYADALSKLADAIPKELKASVELGNAPGQFVTDDLLNSVKSTQLFLLAIEMLCDNFYGDEEG